ncbi:MAG: hypothetical protein ACYTXT_33815 [Nostoc sp.]
MSTVRGCTYAVGFPRLNGVGAIALRPTSYIPSLQVSSKNYC